MQPTESNSFRRGVCADELTFDKDGKINPVTATKKGPDPIVPTTTPATTPAP